MQGEGVGNPNHWTTSCKSKSGMQVKDASANPIVDTDYSDDECNDQDPDEDSDKTAWAAGRKHCC
eukprot:9150907-Alexandrium_andersonii.AAC.1